MTIVGIDMSKNSPGVCIRRDSSLQFISFFRGKDSGKIASHYKALREAGVSLHFYEHNQPKGMEYSESEVWKSMDASRFARWIVSHLPDEVDFVGIEGFSYGSKGNSFIDVVGYGYAIRMAILDKYSVDKFSVFSPGNVKKVAGKGNAGKDQIMEFFLDTNSEDLKGNDLWKGLKDESIDSKKKPVDDLIDGYFVQECTKAHFENKNEQ